MEPIARTPLNRDDIDTHLNLVIELAPKEARSKQGYVRPRYEQEMIERFVDMFAEEEIG